MRRFVLEVRFTVTAETVAEAREKVEQLIEHGKTAHGDVSWDWAHLPRPERPKS